VLHQRLGALRARRELGVTDEAVLSAVACHTTGHPDMDALARCLFVADYTAAGRDFPGVSRLREILGDRGAEAGFRAVLRFKREHVARRGLPEHPWAEGAYRRFLSGRASLSGRDLPSDRDR
jgi:HD superfamily phosphohydrolase YqeK